jgi:hypothetical protein
MKASNPVSMEGPTYDFMAKAGRAIKLISNQLPRAVCKVEANEGQVEKQASAAIGPQTPAMSW